MEGSFAMGLAGLSMAADEPHPLTETDEALAVCGDAGSFVQLYRRHLRSVYAYLYARLGDRQEAEDLAGLTFERALSGLQGYKPGGAGSFRGWLFTIAHRALVDHFRARDPNPVSIEGLAGSLLDPAKGPEEQAIHSDDVRRALKIVSEMGHEQQEVIALRFMAGLPYGEIARVMGKREAAVKMMAYRALEEIRRRFGDEQE